MKRHAPLKEKWRKERKARKNKKQKTKQFRYSYCIWGKKTFKRDGLLFGLWKRVVKKSEKLSKFCSWVPQQDCVFLVSQMHHIIILQSLFSHSFSNTVLLAPVRALTSTVCTSMKKTSFFLAEARICLTSLVFMASGFSHSTFFLAFIKSRQVLRWYGWITPMYTTSADTHTNSRVHTVDVKTVKYQQEIQTAVGQTELEISEDSTDGWGLVFTVCFSFDSSALRLKYPKHLLLKWCDRNSPTSGSLASSS